MIESNVDNLIKKYFIRLQEHLNGLGFEELKVDQKDSEQIFQQISILLDNLLSQYKDLATQYVMLEELLQKSEGECRNHIRIEQRLKIHCENLQEIYDETIKSEDELKQIIANQEKEIVVLKKDLAHQQHLYLHKYEKPDIVRTSSMIDKLSIDNYPKQDLKIFPKQIIQNIPTQKKNYIQLRINRKKRVVTEMDNQQTITKQSVDERQYSSIEKIKDISSIYSRPKSRIYQEQQKPKSITLHVQCVNYQQKSLRSKSQLKK